MEIQEHFISIAESVYKEIDDMVANEAVYNTLEKS